MKMTTRRLLSILWMGATTLTAFGVNKDLERDLDKGNVPSVVEHGAIVRRNGTYYNNRPLYGGHGSVEHPLYWVFAGDLPLIRFGGNPWFDGSFLLGFQKSGGLTKWLMDFKTREARYPGGRMEWVMSDPEFPGVSVRLVALPLGQGYGMTAQAQVSGAGSGDQLVWMLGGAYRTEWVNLSDPMAADGRHVRFEGFNPAQAEGDKVTIQDGLIRIEPPRGEKFRYSQAACSAPSEVRVADADKWKNPAEFLASTGTKRPMACGMTPIKGDEPITWLVRSTFEKDRATALNVAGEFQSAWDRVEGLRKRVTSKTPDPRFDFMVQAASVPGDGLWNYTAFRHGCLSAFPIPLLGWRSTLVGAAYSWHDRVYGAAKHFLASQVKGETYKDEPKLKHLIDDNEELTRYEGSMSHPGNDPRFHSKGRLIPDRNSTMYDMQSQFVDCLVEDWRFTADAEMEKLLRPALELHLDYIDRCFDPRNEGIYESISNTFLTDTVWYNGGGTPDETAFAWRGHLAARDMARRAGDTECEKKHDAKLALIRKGFFGKLWVDKSGHPGAYREQGGNQRLHDEGWLPGLYLPLDCAGLMNDEQKASTLHFVEYALEHEPRPTGGVRVWPSNWVPSIWSNRTKAPGDEYHLALGYCQAGMPDGAMEVIKGNISEGSFESGVPGNLGFSGASCGTDFGDCVAPFTRVVVSGVFGYQPDRPNQVVKIAPQFPAAWDHAEFKHPEFALQYLHKEQVEGLKVELTQAAAMEIELPFRGKGVKSVTLNGQPVEGKVKPGFGRSIFVVRTPVLKLAALELTVDGELPQGLPEARNVEVGAAVELTVEGGKMLELRDAQHLLESPQIAGGKATAKIAANAGNHRVLALVEMGQNAPQYRIFDFNVRDVKAEQFDAEKNLRKAPENATWSGVDLAGVLNGRVSELYLHDYVSPRPETMSLRLAKDAHAVWNSVYVGKLPPGMDLSNTRAPHPATVYDAKLGDLNIGSELTLEAWVAADQCSMAGAQILSLGDLSVELLSFSGRLLRISAADKPVAHFTSPLSGDRLIHVALVVRSGKPGHVYFEGKKYLVETESIDLSKLSLGSTLRMGADMKGGKRLMGRIERVALSNKAVSAQELKNRTLDAAPLSGAIVDWRIPESAPQSVASAVSGSAALERQDQAFTRAWDLPKQLPVKDSMLQVPQGAQFKWAGEKKDIAFTSLWDNWPKKVDVAVNQKGDSVWCLVAGSTNPMQIGIANAVLHFTYADGVVEKLELVNPKNFWSLSPFVQVDYDYKNDAFALPKVPPSQVQLGTNCRAMVYGWKLRSGVELKQVTLETLSQEVIVGLMGVSVCKP